MEPRKEGVVVKEALQLRPAKAVKIEQRKLLSAGETLPVEIPRPQAEILARMLEGGEEVWHVTPKKEETLILAVFDHEPTAEEVTPETIEKFLEESFPLKASVELQGSQTDLKNILANFENLEFKVSDDRGAQTFDMAGLAGYMNERWWSKSQRGEKPREIEEEIPEIGERGFITVPLGTPIRSAPLKDEGILPKVRETTTKQTRLRFMSREQEGNIFHFSIRGKGGTTRGWVTMVVRGKKVEFL